MASERAERAGEAGAVAGGRGGGAPGGGAAEGPARPGGGEAGAAGSLSGTSPAPAAAAPAPSREEAFRLASSRILAAHAADDPFAVLGLPPPTVDALGRPCWECGSSEISRAYRRASLAVHPDRHGGSKEARGAFEAVEAARRRLEDPDALERLLLSRAASAAAELARGETGQGASLCATSAERARKADEILEAQARELRESVLEAAQARARAVERARERRKAAGEQDADRDVWGDGRDDVDGKGTAPWIATAGTKRPRGACGPSTADLARMTEAGGAAGQSSGTVVAEPAAPRVDGDEDGGADAAAAARRKAAARRRRGGGSARAWTGTAAGH